MSHDHSKCLVDPRIAAAAAEGCAESRLLMSRRAMLGVTAGLFSWAYMPKFAEAATNDARLLVVVLRGGMDGINVCVPHGDSHYEAMRGSIALPSSATIKLNDFFGLNPALKNFGAMYKAGTAGIVHAACVPLRTRSHFDCQDNLENGLGNVIAPANQTGWLNRLLTALPAGAPVKKAGAIEIGEAPLILRGPAPVLGWSPTWFEAVRNPTLNFVRALYKEQDHDMHMMLEAGLKANRLASKVGGDDGNISGLRKAFRGAARLVAADDGPRIAVLSLDGFDTHSDQGVTSGQLSDMLTDLDQALGDFQTTAGAAWNKTVVVCATEFGRCVPVNGDSGTDHGVGTVVLLAGGAVNGGKVIADWPGIAANQLFEDHDLKATCDLRSVFKGVLADHIGVPSSLLNSSIFPGSSSVPTMTGLVKSGSSDKIAGGTKSVPPLTEPAIARYRRKLRMAQAN